MSRTATTLIIAATFCLVTGSSATFAQFKFSKGGSRGNFSSNNKGNSKNSSRFSANQSQSRFSNQKKSSSSNNGKGTNNSHTTRFGRFTAPKQTTSSSNFKDLSGRLNSSNKPSSVRTGLTKTLTSNGKTQFGKDIRKSFDQKSGGSQMKTLPFKTNLKEQGIGGFMNNNGNSGEKNDGKSSGKNSWQNVVKNMVGKSFHKGHWCEKRPTACHWWNDYCKPIAHCHHHEVVVCNWNRVHCSTVVHAGVAPQEVQWYLGLKGILLPGKGLGVEAVEAGSPAELVGLQPGMVMTVCNGIPLVDEASMQEAIRISGGVLQMTLLSADGSQVLEGTVQMTRIAAVSF